MFKKKAKDLRGPQKRKVADRENPEHDHGRHIDIPPIDVDRDSDDDIQDVVEEQQEDAMQIESDDDAGPMFVSDGSDSDFTDAEVTEEASPLLYPGSSKTRDAFIVEWIGDCIRRSVSDAAAEDLYQNVRDSMPDTNTLPRTYTSARHMVENITSANIVSTFTSICDKGHTKDSCSCTRPIMSSVTRFDVEKQIAQVKTRLSAEIASYETEMANTVEYADCHQGELYREAKNNGRDPVALYTDGGRYANSGLSECWVVVLFLMCLPPKLRHSYHNAIYVGTWFGTPKPNWDVFMDFLDIETVCKRVGIVQLIADIPARQSLLKMKFVPGYSTCAKCEIIGMKDGRSAVTYPYESDGSETKRTSDQFKAGLSSGMKGISVLCNYLLLPRAITTDVMHSFYAGCIRDDIKRVMNGYTFTKTKKIASLKDKYLKILDDVIERNKTSWPSEIQRVLRKTQNYGFWKGSEWKLFILYVIPAFFTSLMERAASESKKPEVKAMRQKQAYSLFRVATSMRILVQERIGQAEIQAVENMLITWRRERTDLWGPAANTFKSHEVDHLIDQVRDHGPLHTHSAFGGESIIGRIGRLITCRTDTVSSKQIRERLSLERSTAEWALAYGDNRLKEKYVPGSCCHEYTYNVPQMIRTLIGDVDTQGSILFRHFTLRPNTKDAFIAFRRNNVICFGELLAIVKNGPLMVSQLASSNFNERISEELGSDVINSNHYKYCAYLEESANVSTVEVQLVDVLAKCMKFDIEDGGVLVSMPHAYEHS